MKRFSLILALTLVASLACSVAQGQSRELSPPSGRVAAVRLPAVEPAHFADPPAARPQHLTPMLEEPGASVRTADNYAQVMEFLGLNLNPEQAAFLERNRFLLVPGQDTTLPGLAGNNYYSYDEMLGMLDAVGGDNMDPSRRMPCNARLITPDAALHAFHRFFENSLEYLETYELGNDLRAFLAGTQSRIFALMEASAQDRPLYEHYDVLAAQVTVARILAENARLTEAPQYEAMEEEPAGLDSLENAMGLLSQYSARFSPDTVERIKAELTLIYAAEDIVPSPLFGGYDPNLRCDYTQYTPRSHYTKSSALRSYFRAMMFLGRNSYLLNSPDGVADAMLMAHVMAGAGEDGTPLLDVWSRIMDITSFYAGQSDDIGYPEWRDFLVSVLGSETFEPRMALDPQVQATVADRLGELRPPRILSDVVVRGDMGETDKDELLDQVKAFRVFGQRFTFDAWVLAQLTAGEENSDAPLPSTPSALFVAAALGDQRARDFSGDFLRETSDRFPGQAEVDLFLGKLDEVAGNVGRVTDQEWFGCLGSAWLKLLGTLTSTFGQGYPLYMRSPEFQVKQLQTFLGSYTELKHDTLLYAKQNMAEMGGPDWDELPPVPKGFVEPNLAFWYELRRLTDYAIAGFERHGLFEEQRSEWGDLGRFRYEVDFYIRIAEKELSGEPVTEEEFEELRTLSMNHMAAPLIPGVTMDDEERRVALIADISTDAVTGQVLYEATGFPYVMLAFVESEGSPRLAVGVAYNHYEFTAPLGGNRLTDQDWRAMVYDDPAALPQKNPWYGEILTRRATLF